MGFNVTLTHTPTDRDIVEDAMRELLGSQSNPATSLLYFVFFVFYRFKEPNTHTLHIALNKIVSLQKKAIVSSQWFASTKKRQKKQ